MYRIGYFKIKIFTLNIFKEVTLGGVRFLTGETINNK